MSEIATPRPAATIMLIREINQALEVFMVVRHHQIDFASGALVFPGGKVDDQDYDRELLNYCTIIDQAEQAPLMIAAIREAFEESGVLLARCTDSNELVGGNLIQSLQPLRQQLVKGDITFIEILKENQLILACDQLLPFAHWITPEPMPKRFDTHFYLALAPKDQFAAHDGQESVDSVWIQPQQAITEASEDKWKIIFPTRMNLEKLATFESVSIASQKLPSMPVTVLPKIEARDDTVVLKIPAEAGYSITEASIKELKN